MSAEEPELIERLIAAWNRRDIEAMLALADPEIEYVNAPAAVEPGTRHGLDGFAEVLRKQWEGLGPETSGRIERVHSTGNAFVTVGRIVRPVQGSSIEIENRIALRWTFRNRRLCRLEVLGAGSEFERALAAAGIDRDDARGR